jgi:phosphatidylethanolamine-binding protein (PEBP) family uncharacterized protein
MSFALSMVDRVNGGTKLHWVMWDIPATAMMLPAMLPKGNMPGPPAPAGMRQRGSTFAGGMTNPGYFGPGAGGPAHPYELKLWAIKVPKLPVTTETVDVIYGTVLPANSIGAAMITVYGNQAAMCQ